MNNQIFYYFYNFAHQTDFMDRVITFCAVYLPYIVAVLAVLFILFHHKSWREVLRVFITGGLAWAAAEGLKFLIHMPRPFDALANVQALFPENGYAFPSGHATFFSAIAFTIFFKHKKAGLFFLLLAIIIGIARIAGGVHFPIDILGGFIVGAIVAYLVKNV